MNSAPETRHFLASGAIYQKTRVNAGARLDTIDEDDGDGMRTVETILPTRENLNYACALSCRTCTHRRVFNT